MFIPRDKKGASKTKRTDITGVDKQPFNFIIFKYTMFEYPKKHKQREAIFNKGRERNINVVILKSRKDIKNFIECIHAQ